MARSNTPRAPDVHAATDIMEWINNQRKICLQNEKTMAESAGMLEQAMARSAPYEPPVAKKKAKKVANYCRAAAEDCHAEAVHLAKMLKAFQGEYADLLEPKRRNKNLIDWNN